MVKAAHNALEEEFTCGYFAARVCRSCSLLDTPSKDRSPAKQARTVQLLREILTPLTSVSPVVSPKSAYGSRNKVKLIVSGSNEAPLLGILDRGLQGVDLEKCPLMPREVQALIPTLKEMISRYKLHPFNARERRGELKGITILINSTRSEGIVRCIVRSTESIPRIRKAVKELREHHPWIKVVSTNLQPLPAALPEGPEEDIITTETTMTERYNGIPIYFGPQSFMQVTHETAEALYHTAACWVEEIRPENAIDLFCGAGGFALHVAPYVKHITGLEISKDAITCARRSAHAIELANVTFEVRNVEEMKILPTESPDLVIVNPPRRGLTSEVRDQLQRAAPKYLLYSSCNPETFVRDIRDLQRSYDLSKVAPFDMFPMTEHVEVLGLLVRR